MITNKRARISGLALSFLVLLLASGCQTSSSETASGETAATTPQVAANPVLSAAERSCIAGEAEACNDMADFYLESEDPRKNIDKILYFYQKACDLKSGRGCYTLGRIKTVQDESLEGQKQAHTMFRQAAANFEQECLKGITSSCY